MKFRLTQATSNGRVAFDYQCYEDLVEVLETLLFYNAECNPDCKYSIDVIGKEVDNESL